MHQCQSPYSGQRLRLGQPDKAATVRNVCNLLSCVLFRRHASFGFSQRSQFAQPSRKISMLTSAVRTVALVSLSVCVRYRFVNCHIRVSVVRSNPTVHADVWEMASVSANH
jgi:hypothetical protein